MKCGNTAEGGMGIEIKFTITTMWRFCTRPPWSKCCLYMAV